MNVDEGRQKIISKYFVRIEKYKKIKKGEDMPLPVF
jgi:hypothetical protein